MTEAKSLATTDPQKVLEALRGEAGLGSGCEGVPARPPTAQNEPAAGANPGRSGAARSRPCETLLPSCRSAA